MHPQHPMTLDPIPSALAATLPGLFQERCRRSPQGEAYREFEAGQWRSFSWEDMAGRAERWRRALAREGLGTGERVAVMMRNCTDWVCFDQAALSLGLVVVPLYPTDNPENIAYILHDCGARVLLLGDAARWESLAPLHGGMPQLGRVVVAGSGVAGAAPLVRTMEDWLAGAAGDALPPTAPRQTQDLATIVYTSGTTGRPKGVMLSHHNILSNTDAVLKLVHGYREDVYLSFLPLSHTLERTVGYYLPMMTGSTVAFARSVQDLAQDLLTVRPTMLVSVPRVYERVYARMQQGLDDGGAPARKLFEWAESVGWQRFEAAQHRGSEPGPVAEMMWPVLRHLVADKLLAHLGGRLRVAVSGGAPLSPRIAHCFIGLGLPLLQGYGLTEASPIVTANTLEDNVPDSVGVPIPGVEVSLGESDELLVRGPNVMLGYWGDPSKTAATVDAQGWLHTGDIGRIDERGHVHIVGRLKEILVTSTGEKVPPADLELAIMEDPLFEQAMVFGEQKPFLAALLVLQRDAWAHLAPQLGKAADDPQALDDPAVQRALVERIRPRLASFPAYAAVRAVAPTLEPWTVDNGLLTPTLKLRRARIAQRYLGRVEQLYERRPA